MRVTVFVFAALMSGCSSPTSPESTGEMEVRVACTEGNPLVCAARTFCFANCSSPAGEGMDVTTAAEWTVEPPGIVRQVERNTFAAVTPGDTAVTVRHAGSARATTLPLSVFANTPPLPTVEVWGRVTDAATGQEVSGAVVEFTSGVVAGRTATSGASAALLPGYTFVLRGANGFQFFGVPRGTYDLAIRATGYAGQTRTVLVSPTGALQVNFQLVRQ
jgi:hypothetical protein